MIAGETEMGDILIVDDERDIRELVADILQDEAYATRLAATSDKHSRKSIVKRPISSFSTSGSREAGWTASRS